MTGTIEDLTTEELLSKFIRLRDHKSAITKKAKEDTAVYDDAMRSLEVVIEARMKAAGADSIKTNAGTVFVKRSQMATVGDWPAFYDYIRENDRFDMLYKKANSKVIVEHMEGEEGEPSNSLPPGVQLHEEERVQVRRPTGT